MKHCTVCRLEFRVLLTGGDALVLLLVLVLCGIPFDFTTIGAPQ